MDGLVSGDVCQLSWSDVSGWVVQGGSLLGTKRTLPTGKFQQIADTIEKFKIQVISQQAKEELLRNDNRVPRVLDGYMLIEKLLFRGWL